MTLQSSGAISLSDIRDEYNNGSSAPILLNDYYRGGSLVRANALTTQLQIYQQMYRQAQIAVHYLLMIFMDEKSI